MREQILDLHVDRPPSAVAERLLQAAADASREYGETFEVTVDGEEIHISTPAAAPSNRVPCASAT